MATSLSSISISISLSPFLFCAQLRNHSSFGRLRIQKNFWRIFDSVFHGNHLLTSTLDSPLSLFVPKGYHRRAAIASGQPRQIVPSFSVKGENRQVSVVFDCKCKKSVIRWICWAVLQGRPFAFLRQPPSGGQTVGGWFFSGQSSRGRALRRLCSSVSRVKGLKRKPLAPAAAARSIISS